MRRLKTILSFAFIVFFSQLNSQNFVLNGRITGKGEPLAFATIIVKGTSIGTNSNADGYYSLKLPAGSHKIIYEYIGFSKKEEIIVLNANKKLDVSLSPDGIALQEIEINAGEDPAVSIMKKAIGQRNYYLHQNASYCCNAYIKGLQKIDELPKNIKGLIKLFGGNLSDTADIKGVIYLSESESKYFYAKPDNEKEIMFSSKVSGDNRSFSFNKLSDMKLNFYNNLVEMGNLSGKPFISPLHENAFLFYRYYLLGTLQTEGKPIHKIKVVPKQKTDPCFSGTIYIQDSTWRITSVDLMLTKEVKIQFVDTLYIKQLYASIKGDEIWMPITLNFNFDFKAFGFKGGGYFNAHISNYTMDTVFEKNFFKNEVLVVQEGSNKKDSSYWAEHRAVLLTPEEQQDYLEKDSIMKIRNTDWYKDSVDKVNNRIKIRDLLFGYNYTNTKDNFTIKLPGLITNGIQYNTVEGLNLSYYFSLNKKYKDFKEYTLGGRVRYGFSNQLFGGELAYNYLYKPLKQSSFGIKVKSIAEQFNKKEPITPLVNSLYTLLLNENYMKLFRESGAEASYFSEVHNGVFFNSVLGYLQRDPLYNSTDLLLIDDKTKLFTSNDPQHKYLEDSSFTSHQALSIEITLKFRFRQKYQSLPQQKIIIGTKYPRLSITYKKALSVIEGMADYDLVTALVTDAVKLGFFGRFEYNISGGLFLDAKTLYFMDYHHFMGNQTIFNTNNYLNSFRLLPYYSFSANKWFSEFHAEQHFKGALLGSIPLLRKINAQEVIGFHALSSNSLKYYYEVNFGLEHIFRIVRVDYILGYTPHEALRYGFTIGLQQAF